MDIIARLRVVELCACINQWVSRDTAQYLGEISKFCSWSALDALKIRDNLVPVWNPLPSLFHL